MRILVICDTHFKTLEDIESLEKYKYDIDYCFCLGDISLGFLITLKRIFNDNIYGILGNHDRFDYLSLANITNMNQTIIELDGLSILGLSGSWKYKDGDHILLSDKESIDIMNQFKQVNILFSHDTYKDFDKTRWSHQGLLGITKYLTPKIFSSKYVDINIHGHNHKKHNTMFKKTNVIGVFPFAIITIDKINNHANITQVIHVE